ncbi:hypothetical protein FQN57_005567 [Myotisia sp. PD_48]|nr:hypothetical protein FQN57_005567 [Myotisia sp. PD_48]
MDGFDTMAMPYLASPLSMSHLQNGDYLNAMPGLDIPPHQTFDHETFVSGDDMSFSQPPMSAHPLRRYSSNQFDDPFPDIIPTFDAIPPDQPPADASIDHNNKLLGFSNVVYNFTLLDYSVRRTSLSMSAQLHGMFFLAESPWTTSPTGEPSGPPPIAELTCYRRNLFQITGSVTLPRTLRYIMTEQGDRIPILAQELTVSATESVEGNPVKIISVPWKTPAANATGQPEDKTEKEPPPVPLDTMAGQDMDSDYATFPIAWKRLQFRIATANNGRRKELQQHFVVRLKIVATLSTGAKIPICEAHSGPVIVRGRSPRNFQTRKDLPLSGSAAASRKNTQAAAALARSHADARSQQAASKRSKSPQDSIPAPRALKLDGDSKLDHQAQTAPSESNASPQAHHQQQQHQQQTQHQLQLQHPPSASLPDWSHITAPVTAHSTNIFTSAAIANAATITSPALMTHAQSNPEISRQSDRKRRLSSSIAPISLSLLDEGDRSPADSTVTVHGNNNNTSAVGVLAGSLEDGNSNRTNSRREPFDQPPTKTRKKSSPGSLPAYPSENFPFSTQQFHLGVNPLVSPPIINPNETADLLYEYFPLGLDDWQAPVDAVYRPHVVHHTNLPDDPKAIAARSRSKRYFTGEGN